MATEKRMPAGLFFERLLLVVTLLGLALFCIGFPLFIVGRILDDFTVARIGVYIFLAGIILLFIRILYWIIEEIVGRGLD